MSERTGANALNSICPYFTMFPVAFPLEVLRGSARPADWVLDPFCGRGTTNFAARTLGLNTVGIDSSLVATAIASAKLAVTTPEAVVAAARRILSQDRCIVVPTDDFWERAFHPRTLRDLCCLRAALLDDCRSDARQVLRAVVMGGLHGPLSKGEPSYFSNQSPRTYAPKPGYAVKYWTRHGLVAPEVKTLRLIERRARRALGALPLRVDGYIHTGDSREPSTWSGLGRRFRWVVTSPPYYGMVTYVPDQWLRSWFVGGRPQVDYRIAGQVSHRGREEFQRDLQRVWTHVAEVSLPDVRMVVRFGAINDRAVDPVQLASRSLQVAGWTVTEARPAGSASDGRRQADHFVPSRRTAIDEVDLYCRLL